MQYGNHVLVVTRTIPVLFHSRVIGRTYVKACVVNISIIAIVNRRDPIDENIGRQNHISRYFLNVLAY